MNSTCPHCGKPVPSAALGGLCPECLLKAGLLSGTEDAAKQREGSRFVAAHPPKPEEIAPLFPHLEILEYLGRGGMGAVYKARQPKLNRLVALKIIARDKEHDPSFAERFTREAQTLARLNHPNIVAVHDFGEVAGLCYLLMEFVDGLSLRQLILGGRIAPEQALAVVPRICEALQFAHEHGIVHRDIKPENILLDKAGRVKIADFGIAKMLGMEGERTHLTAERQIIGTPHYMAPEQVERPRSVDHRADIYSLGVVFYEMLTGELPLGKFQPPSRKVQVDVRLDEVVLQALEKEPERRYQHASQVKSAVETIVNTPGDFSAQTHAKEDRSQAARSGSRFAMVPWFIAGALLLLVAVLLNTPHDRDNASLSDLRATNAATEPGPVALTVSPDGIPPVVIGTTPESGATNVDASLTEIRVAFSKSMAGGSWSWSTWGDENFPETAGEPYYLKDQRTCVLPVKLKRGKLYALWLNSGQFTNFKDQSGQPSVPYLLIFETGK